MWTPASFWSDWFLIRPIKWRENVARTFVCFFCDSWLLNIILQTSNHERESEEELGETRRCGGGFQGCVWESRAGVDLNTCPSPHSCTFLGPHRQSVVRGPGTDLGFICQRQISPIDTAELHIHTTHVALSMWTQDHEESQKWWMEENKLVNWNDWDRW